MSVDASEMPVDDAAAATVANVFAKLLKGTGVQLLSLQSAVGLVALSYLVAEPCSVPLLTETVPSA